jgi:PAS domain-containing protein
VFDACPLPAVKLDQQRRIKTFNEAFQRWLELDRASILVSKLDHVMILRGPGLEEAWQALFRGAAQAVRFHATYASPGKVRAAHALALPLAADRDGKIAGALVLYETLAGQG